MSQKARRSNAQHKRENFCYMRLSESDVKCEAHKGTDFEPFFSQKKCTPTLCYAREVKLFLELEPLEGRGKIFDGRQTAEWWLHGVALGCHQICSVARTQSRTEGNQLR